ncbi:DNA methyltransferase [[Haemophilus] felis]|nr:DNA methyltransferase [[Haemophilus] felis]
MNNNVSDFLKDKYEFAMTNLGSNNEVQIKIENDIKLNIDTILKYSESSKAVFTVVLTSLVYKILNPKQDIRKHQASIEGGYSGRTFDSQYITPFLKKYKFPAMAESGWLTRSLEQKVMYDEHYTGAIKPDNLKSAFLIVIKYIQKGNGLNDLLSYIFQGLILQRNAQKIDLAKPHNLPILNIVDLLERHFFAKYTSEGASRLPVLALYAIYECLVRELKRFENKTLLPMESHTSADSRSGRIGDIDVNEEDNKAFEAVEVKHGIPISLQLVQDAFEKFKTTQVNRYYILSTANIVENEKIKIEEEIEKIKNIHGCHVIANGLISSLKYYLRLIDNTSLFIENYVNLLENDTALKFEHKAMWNKLISTL